MKHVFTSRRHLRYCYGVRHLRAVYRSTLNAINTDSLQIVNRHELAMTFCLIQLQLTIDSQQKHK